jgi:O-acetyl-ADP-ribose deacetylase (regulator of RNase III)
MLIEIIKGDITTMAVDAIVNAANTSLLGGGGVDGAIHRKGGKAILDACVEIRNKQGGCKVGEAVITVAGNLPAKYVIHTVGPVWNGGNSNEVNKLASAYLNSLELALEHGIKTIAFPNISTGIYGYPKENAANIVLLIMQAIKLNKKFNSIEKVLIVCFDDENFEIYNRLAKK